MEKTTILLFTPYFEPNSHFSGSFVANGHSVMRHYHHYSNISLGFSSIIPGLLLAQVIGSLPISPGFLTAYESSLTYFYTLFGVQVHAALIITLLYRFFTFWLPIPIGLILYRNLQR